MAAGYTKRCPTCGEEKEADDFYKNKNTKDGLQGYCKPCHRAHVKRTMDPERKRIRQRDWMLQRLYGITQADYEAMLVKQGGLCGICKGSKSDADRPLCVDHCHETGTVRGLLCGPCNRALAHFADEEWLVNAAAYVKQA